MAEYFDEPPIHLALSNIPKEVLEDLVQRAAENGSSLEQEVARILIDHVGDQEGA